MSRGVPVEGFRSQLSEAQGHWAQAFLDHVGALIVRIGFWGFLVIIVPILIIKAPT